jgi:hypothetical protein
VGPCLKHYSWVLAIRAFKRGVQTGVRVQSCSIFKCHTDMICIDYNSHRISKSRFITLDSHISHFPMWFR